MIQTSLPRGFVWSLLLTCQHSSAIFLAWRISSFFTFLVKTSLDHRLYFCILFWCIHFHSPRFMATSWLHLNWYFQLWTSTMLTSRCLSYIIRISMSWQFMSCFTQSGEALSVSSSHRDRNSCTLSTDINIYFLSFRYSFYLISILGIISPILFNYSDHMDHCPDTLNWIASQNDNIYSSNFLCLFHNQLACWWYHL